MNEAETTSCEILGIKINGLFGKTNISFDLSNDCTILIGENGIGKTTALKMLQNILDEDYISLATYYFESIEFISESSDFKFEYNDFLVPIQIIEDAFYNANNKQNNEYKILRRKFMYFMDELVNKNLVGQFLHDIYCLEYSVSIRNIVKKYFDINILDNLRREMLISTDIMSYEVTKFYKSGVYKIIRNSRRFCYPIFSDMVNKVVLYDGEDSFVKYRYSAKIDNEYKDFKYVYWKCNSFTEIENKINLIVDGDLSLYIEYPDGHSIEFDGLFCEENKVLQLLREYKMQKGFFDINSAIKCLYFSTDVVQQINDISVDGLKKHLELLRSFAKYTTEEIRLLLDQIDETIIFIHKQYIFPLLAEENPFKFNIEKMINDINAHLETNCYSDIFWESIYLLESYMMVYKKLESFSISETYIDNKITVLESFVKDFIKDKALYFTPAGLSVYSTEMNEKVKLEYEISDLSDGERLNVILGKSLDRVPNYIQETISCNIGNENSQIQLSKLSSGESKIIVLAFYTMISNWSSILIMDEPELSTSIIWQEELVPAIMDYGEFSSVVIATHSPYIVRNPSLNEYIEYLP